MKIAFLTPEYPHIKTGHSGGIGTSIKNLARGLILQDCTVRVLVYGQSEDAIFDDAGIIVQQIKNVKFKGLTWILTRKKIEKIINRLYATKKIDLVEAADWTGITSFISPNSCPIIIRLHGSDTYFCHLDQRPVKWINKFHEKRSLQKANALLSVSQYTANVTNQIFGLNKEFTIIPNPIDANTFFYSDKGSREEKTILYFGSMIRKKGLLELPLIFNKVVEKEPKAKLILVGQDVPDVISGASSTWDMMRKMFSDKAIENVRYIGSIPYSDMKSKIAGATICVFPSFAEAFPVSWLEAMAMETPIVASNIGWASEMIIDKESGFLVHPTDHSLFASRINYLFDNSELALIIGKNARKHVKEKFDIDKIARLNIAFYQSVILDTVNLQTNNVCSNLD